MNLKLATPLAGMLLAAGACSSAGRASSPLPVSQETASRERRAEITMRFNLNAPPDSKRVRCWIPYAVSDENQTIEDVRVAGNYSRVAVYREGEKGNLALYAEWEGPGQERSLTYAFRVARREAVRKDFPAKEAAFSEREFAPVLGATSLGPTSGKVRETALRIAKGKETTAARARAIYDWIVENMRRDPDVKGCGPGDVVSLLETCGGKCADLHSVFVALAKAVGVPAREVFGIRIPKGKEGDMTKAQHCWAEFYAPGYGWVPVDPSDVRKAMLEKKVATPAEVKDLVEYYFGAVDESRVSYHTGRDVLLSPPQEGSRLNYFMYPYAEADGKPLGEDLYGFNIGYQIGFKEP